MAKHYRGLLAVLVGAALVLTTSACSSGDDGSTGGGGSTTNLTVAVPSLGLDYNWDLLVAKEMGFFSEVGLNVTLTNFNGPAPSIAALAGGSAQFAGGIATDQTLTAHGKGTHVSIIAGENYALDEVMVKPGIASWNDAKGKTFATATPNSGSTLLLQRALEHEGLALTDVKMRPFNTTSDRAAALIAGQVDGAALAQPFDFQAKAKGFNTLSTLRDILGDYPFTGHVVNTDYAAAHKDVVVNYLKAVIKAQAWLADSANKTKAAQILSKYSKAEQSLSEQTWDYVYTTAHGAVLNGAITEESLQAVLTAAQQESGDNSLQIGNALDLSYLNQATAK